ALYRIKPRCLTKAKLCSIKHLETSADPLNPFIESGSSSCYPNCKHQQNAEKNQEEEESTRR
ncbi:hypothetical protein TSAR_010189, partial [Trichomalopsis sarcophagae]